MERERELHRREERKCKTEGGKTKRGRVGGVFNQLRTWISKVKGNTEKNERNVHRNLVVHWCYPNSVLKLKLERWGFYDFS